MDWMCFKDVNCSVIKLWSLSQTLPRASAPVWQQHLLPHSGTEKNKSQDKWVTASRERARQETQRLLIPTGDASTLTPANSG